MRISLRWQDAAKLLLRRVWRTRGLLPDPVPRVTDEEVREMARLFASGMSVREVAKATKRNMRTVRDHLRETRAIR